MKMTNISMAGPATQDPSPDSTMHDFDDDPEMGKKADTLQLQSRRLAALMRERTEIRLFDPNHVPPKDNFIEEGTSGIRYWQREVATAEEHGGDYCDRLKTATRAALGSFLTFGILVFPHQNVLGAGKPPTFCRSTRIWFVSHSLSVASFF
jgi:hypothetical protein